MDEYFVYIDAAGDEGFGKLRTPQAGGQSKWLALGGIVVGRENDRQLPQWRDQIMEHFPNRAKRDLHFQKLKHEQRVAACRFLSEKPFGAAVVCSDKVTIPDLNQRQLEIFKQKGHLYNYLVRLLLERVTAACSRKSAINGQTCKIYVTFSKRGGTDYESMRDYLFLMRDGRERREPVRSIDWNTLNPEDIKVEDHSKRAGLQLADVVTSATCFGLEPNQYGDSEERYARLLSRRFLRGNGRVSNFGVTILPSTSSRKDSVRTFLNGL